MRRLFLYEAAALALICTAASSPFAVADPVDVSAIADGKANNDSEVENTTSRELAKQISELVSALGSEQYAVRRQAQLDLERIGVPALDQLQQAILNSDPQIATAAKYMVRSSYIRWTGREDPLNVRKLLEQYGSGDVIHRSERIDKLSALPDRKGIPALLRIARYETSIDLSKRAALAVLNNIKPAVRSFTDPSDSLQDLAKQNETWPIILQSIGPAKGTASSWLKKYAESLRDKTPLDSTWWQSAIDNEFRLVDNKSGESSREIVSELTRWTAEQLVNQGQMEMALAIAKNLLRITYSLREQAKESEDLYLWALDRKLPAFVTEHSDKYFEELDKQIAERKANQKGNPQGNFQGNQIGNPPFGIGRSFSPFATKLRYLRAEAFRQLNDVSAAERESKIAFDRNDSPDETEIYERCYYGDFLRDRMQFDWAEQELQKAWQLALDERKLELSVSYKLAMMLSDGEDYYGAEKALRPLVERFESEPEFAREIDNDIPAQTVFLPEERAILQSQRMRSLWLYFRAKSKLQSNQIDSAWEDLQAALVSDPENVDIIISMMEMTDASDPKQLSGRVEKSMAPQVKMPERRDEAKKAFASAVLAFRESLPRLEKNLRTSSDSDRATHQSHYSIALNTYAWLLASTGHDLEYALECSELACRLAPNNAAYIDTLARCNFRIGNIEDAITLQKQAIAAEPSMRELRRNLEDFQAAKK
jgi:hypothetical protein